MAAVATTDSICLHDSIRVEYRHGGWLPSTESNKQPAIRSPDTVYMERWHTRWRERTVVRCDTVLVDNLRTETVRVRYVPRFYKVCAGVTIFGLLLAIMFLIRRINLTI